MRGVWPEVSAETRLAELDVPTLVVVGDADLAVVPGAGHLVGVDEPEELNALLLEFLED